MRFIRSSWRRRDFATKTTIIKSTSTKSTVRTTPSAPETAKMTRDCPRWLASPLQKERAVQLPLFDIDLTAECTLVPTERVTLEVADMCTSLRHAIFPADIDRVPIRSTPAVEAIELTETCGVSAPTAALALSVRLPV